MGSATLLLQVQHVNKCFVVLINRSPSDSESDISLTGTTCREMSSSVEFCCTQSGGPIYCTFLVFQNNNFEINLVPFSDHFTQKSVTLVIFIARLA